MRGKCWLSTEKTSKQCKDAHPDPRALVVSDTAHPTTPLEHIQLILLQCADLAADGSQPAYCDQAYGRQVMNMGCAPTKSPQEKQMN